MHIYGGHIRNTVSAYNVVGDRSAIHVMQVARGPDY